MTLALPKPQYKKERKAKQSAKATDLAKTFTLALKLDGPRCWNPYCKSVVGKDPAFLHPEHVMPRARGRDDSITNIAVCCDMCNRHTAQGSTLYGGYKSGDEIKLMILEAIKDRPGFRFEKQLEYFRSNVERKKGRKAGIGE